MFAKLLKHEWKASAPLLSVLSIAAVSIGLLGAGAMQLAAYPASGELNKALSETFAGISKSFVNLALFLYMAAVGIILLYRFYKNKFAEQGYLTFTLPVTGHQILLSSLTNMLLWELIALLVVILSKVLMSVLGHLGQETTEAAVDLGEYFDEIRRYMTDEEAKQWWKTVTLLLLQIPVAWIYGNVLLVTSITIGAAWAKKHKLLAAFAIFYGTSYLLSFVSGIVMVAAIATENTDSFFPSFQRGLLSITVAELLLTVGGYFLSHYMITRKLNLK